MTDSQQGTQNFELGYELITWDLRGHSVPDALTLLRTLGFNWFEALLDDTLGGDYARRHLTLGPARKPRFVADHEMFDRLAFFADAHHDFGLRLSSLYVDGEWVNPNLWPHELAKSKVVARFLASVEAPIFVCGGGPQEGAAERTAGDYREFSDRLADVGRYTADLGIRTVYHPHLDTFVETQEQLERLMQTLDTQYVGLCIDPAHFQAQGQDPAALVQRYAAEIDYVHLKDWKPVGSSTGYDRYAGFCELGQGQVDLPAIVSTLAAANFHGLMIVELDYSDTPDESARINATYLRETLGLKLASP